jgi:hypothetical protein
LEWRCIGEKTEHPSWIYCRRWEKCHIYHNFGRIKRKNDGRWDWWITSKHWNIWHYRLHTEQGVADTFEGAKHRVEEIVASLAPAKVES